MHSSGSGEYVSVIESGVVAGIARAEARADTICTSFGDMDEAWSSSRANLVLHLRRLKISVATRLAVEYSPIMTSSGLDPGLSAARQILV